MKNTTLSFMALSLIFLISCGGNSQEQENSKASKVTISIDKDTYRPAEKEALIILKAYADQDLETLKSYAGGAQKMALDETYFTENGNVKGFMEKIENWPGDFTDIRYYDDEINFQHVYYAVAAFYKSPSGQITGVGLRSTDKENWQMSGFGTKYMKSDEFNALSSTLPE